MKTLFLGMILVVAIGCGGSPPVAGEPDICAMNPIAHGCQLESVQGAVADGFKTNPRFLGNYSYVCDGNLNTVSGVSLSTAAWVSRYQPVDWANPLPTRVSMKPRPGQGDGVMVMTRAMDGPYHVIYNSAPSAQYGLVSGASSAAGNAALEPVIIPAYGTWIYAPNERPDYPTGVMVTTFDPDPSVPFVAGDGRCSSARVQFVSPL